jgi:hypothetical protein
MQYWNWERDQASDSQLTRGIAFRACTEHLRNGALATTFLVLRVGVPWMTVRDAVYDAVRSQQPPLVIRQRSNGELRVRELRRGPAPVRIDIELYTEGAEQTVIELRDATGLSGRFLPGTSRRRREVVEAMRRCIESAAAKRGSRVRRIDNSGTAGLDPVGQDAEFSPDVDIVQVSVTPGG